MAEAGKMQVGRIEAGSGTVSAGSGLRAIGVVNALRQQFEMLPSHRKTWLIAGVTFLLAIIAGMFWYVSRPDWRVLFSGLDSKDTQQVSQELAAAGIPAQISVDGTAIQVPADQLNKGRMEVATKGMPQSGRLGFELFDKPNWVGSEFDERVNYQRALEGELEHTVETLGVVRSARVHLALPQASLFAQDQRPAKASVVLRLKRASLAVGEADSIRNLVSGAVENLSPDQVTLVDADGRANLQSPTRSAAEANAEQMMEAKLVAMLEPLAGRDNIRATVNVAYEDKSEERTDEVYDPSQSAAVTVQKSERATMGGPKIAGVPGTASNAPAASAAGAVAGSDAAAAAGTPPLLQKQGLPVYPQASAASQTAKEESGTYAVTKHTTHTEAGADRVRRVTAAVVVNDRQIVDGVGKTAHTTWKPRSVEEMHRLEELAQAAVGFDLKRGDQVVLENVSFESNVPAVAATATEKALQEAKNLVGQPGVLRIAMLGTLSLILVLFVLRPLTKQVVTSLKEPLLVNSGTRQQALLEAENAVALREADAAAAIASANELQAQQWLNEGATEVGPIPLPVSVPVRIARAKPKDPVYHDVMEHIRREPGQSTRLLEAWIGSSDEGAV